MMKIVYIAYMWFVFPACVWAGFVYGNNVAANFAVFTSVVLAALFILGAARLALYEEIKDELFKRMVVQPWWVSAASNAFKLAVLAGMVWGGQMLLSILWVITVACDASIKSMHQQWVESKSNTTTA